MSQLRYCIQNLNDFSALHFDDAPKISIILIRFFFQILINYHLCISILLMFVKFIWDTNQAKQF